MGNDGRSTRVHSPRQRPQALRECLLCRGLPGLLSAQLPNTPPAGAVVPAVRVSRAAPLIRRCPSGPLHPAHPAFPSGVCEGAKRLPRLPEGPGENGGSAGQGRLAAHGGHREMVAGERAVASRHCPGGKRTPRCRAPATRRRPLALPPFVPGVGAGLSLSKRCRSLTGLGGEVHDGRHAIGSGCCFV